MCNISQLSKGKYFFPSAASKNQANQCKLCFAFAQTPVNRQALLAGLIYADRALITREVSNIEAPCPMLGAPGACEEGLDGAQSEAWEVMPRLPICCRHHRDFLAWRGAIKSVYRSAFQEGGRAN